MISRFLTTVLLSASTLAAVQQPTPPQARTPSWAMRYGNPARTGQSPAPGATLGSVDWQFPIAGEPHSFAVDSAGRIQVGVVFLDAFWSNESYAYALDAGGGIAWRAKVTPYSWGASQGVSSSSAIDARGRTVTPSSNGDLIQFTATGQVAWTLPGTASASNDSSPLVRPDGSIVHYQIGQGLRSIASDGRVLWVNTAISTSRSCPALAPNGDLAIGGVKSNEPHNFPALHYVNADGSTRWVYSTLYGSSSNPIFGPDGIVYCSTDGLRAFRPDGSIQWSKAFGGLTPALSSGGVLYVPNGSQIIGLDPATGTQLSTITAPGPVLDGLAIGRDGTIYATTSNGFACAYDPAGPPLFEQQVCDSFVTGPVIGGDRNVVAGGLVGFDHVVFSIE
jgi:sugar lactone lactonase YvrE